MDQSTKQNLFNVDTWIRLLFMVLFLFLMELAAAVIIVVAILQFLHVLITGSDNEKLRDIGQIAAKWFMQSINFLTFNFEQKPFPFDDWPELDAVDEATPVPGTGNLEAAGEPPEEPAPEAQPFGETVATGQNTSTDDVNDDVPSFVDTAGSTADTAASTEQAENTNKKDKPE